jgi:hypothetical protein
MKMVSMLIGVAAVIALFVASRGGAQNVEEVTYVYTAKVVCAGDDAGTDPDDGLLGNTSSVLPNLDVYLTDVNLLNPADTEAVIEARVILAHRPGAAPLTSAPFVYRLSPLDAITVTCLELENQLRGAAHVPGGSGFLILRSDRELEVAAVYAIGEKTGCPGGPAGLIRRRSTRCNGAGAALDVEYIKPRQVVGQRLPDLLGRFIATPTIDCGANQDCTISVWFEIRNGGGADAGPFVVAIEADTFASGQVEVPGLAAGAVVQFMPTLAGTPASASCDDGCNVVVRTDEFGEVAESDESNNQVFATAITRRR